MKLRIRPVTLYYLIYTVNNPKPMLIYSYQRVAAYRGKLQL